MKLDPKFGRLALNFGLTTISFLHISVKRKRVSVCSKMFFFIYFAVGFLQIYSGFVFIAFIFVVQKMALILGDWLFRGDNDDVVHEGRLSSNEQLDPSIVLILKSNRQVVNW